MRRQAGVAEKLSGRVVQIVLLQTWGAYEWGAPDEMSAWLRWEKGSNGVCFNSWVE